jgi:selenocysteine lyase/cysteine desulfurase
MQNQADYSQEMPEIWEEFAADFPVRRNIVYLNHAGVSPLCRPAAEAMKQVADESCEFGSLHYERWLAAYEGVREAAGCLIGCSAREIAIVKNTSEGINTVANGIQWKPGDRLVAFREEFPSNWLPWRHLESRGVTVRWLPATASLDEIDQAARGARLLAISYVQYLSGYRANLEAIGEICQRRNVFFFVDAIQGLGLVPLDVNRFRIHALAADGHKWLMGPEGCGVLYVRAGIQDQILPTEIGWMSVTQYDDIDSSDLTLRRDAARYECGSLNTIGCYGLRAAIEFVNRVGVLRIRDAVLSLADGLYSELALRGFEMCGVRTSENSAGIVSFRKPGEEARETARHLLSRGFMTAPRQGWVRVSPHFYIPPGDIDNLIRAATSESRAIS